MQTIHGERNHGPPVRHSSLRRTALCGRSGNGVPSRTPLQAPVWTLHRDHQPAWVERGVRDSVGDPHGGPAARSCCRGCSLAYSGEMCRPVVPGLPYTAHPGTPGRGRVESLAPPRRSGPRAACGRHAASGGGVGVRNRGHHRTLPEPWASDLSPSGTPPRGRRGPTLRRGHWERLPAIRTTGNPVSSVGCHTPRSDRAAGVAAGSGYHTPWGRPCSGGGTG